MTTETYDLKFLTPCFCAGARQDQAEIRPSAIRGALRWWFRVLGGSLKDEREIFGSVHGESPMASKIIVRARTGDNGGQEDWSERIPKQGTDRAAYLLSFFCGRTRLQGGGALAPGSTATVWITWQHTRPELADFALRAFFSIGGVGFRATRAAGSFASNKHPLKQKDWNDLSAKLVAAGFNCALLPEPFGDWVELVNCAGSLLKHKLRSGSEGLGIGAGKDGTSPNALGSAEPRQASVVHFRAVQIDNCLRLALLEPPHDRILGAEATKAHENRGSILRLARL
ncbi:MAG: type III-B CRISPR module RAMP protein Cmr1 [Limisphaerales bacterium]